MKPVWVLVVEGLTYATPVLVAAAALALARRTLRLRRLGSRTTGTVTWVGRHKNYYAIVRYEAGGAVHELEADLKVGRYEVGERVPVRYLPADPRVAVVDYWTERWFLPVGGWLAAAALAYCLWV